MNRLSVIRLMIVFIAIIAPFNAMCQQVKTVKELEDEKALIEAQSAVEQAKSGARSTEIANQIKAIQDDQALAKAKEGPDLTGGANAAAVAKSNSEAAVIAAEAALAKARAESAIQPEKLQLENDTNLTTAKINNELATYSALKSALGDAPTLGNDGSLTIENSKDAVLLQVKGGSLQVSWKLAQKLCDSLHASSIKDAYFAPVDLEIKIQSSRMFLSEFESLVLLVKQDQILSGAKAQSATAAIATAAAVVQYGAGAVQSLAKLFKSDYSVSLSETSREAWFEYFVASKCPNEIPNARLDLEIRKLGHQKQLDELRKLSEFYDEAANIRSALEKKIQDTKDEIAQLKQQKQSFQGAQSDLETSESTLDSLKKLDTLLPRIKTLINHVSANPNLYLDAFVWVTYDTDSFKNRSRIFVSLVTQDEQIYKNNWLLGKRLYGKSAGELIYRVTNSTGKIEKAGFFLATYSTGKINFSSSNTESDIYVESE